MKRYFIPLLLVALGWNLALGTAALSRQYLPIVAAQSSAPVMLHDGDHGLISAAQVAGRWYVAYQTRPDGRLHIAEDTGSALVDVPAPAQQALLPSFEPPGPKQGSSALVADGSSLRIYYTGRSVGDPTGPFKLWRMVVTP